MASLKEFFAPRYNVYMLDLCFHVLPIKSFNTFEEAKTYGQDMQLEKNIKFFITKESCL